MKKIAIFLFGSMCVFNIAYAMQEKNKSKHRPKSLELGSYFLHRNFLKLRNAQIITKMDIVDSKINPLYDFSEEWLKYMGKMANQILPLTDNEKWLSLEQFDNKFVTKHEQLAGAILPDSDEFLEI